MQTRYCDENSVCPSVKRVYCDKTVERSVQIYIPYERTFSLVFWEKWLVGGGRPLLPEILGLSYGMRPLVPEILDQSDRVNAKLTIFDLFSLVAPEP